MQNNKKIKMNSVKYNFIMNSILKMSAFIFPLITFPYVSRVLGAEGNGQVSFASAFVSYFAMVATLGIPTYGIRACAQCRDNKEQLSRTVHELLIISMIMTIVSYVVMVLMILTVPKLAGRETIILISSISILLTSVGMEWFYQAIEQYGYITYRNLAFKVVSVVFMFLFVHDRGDYILYAGINVLGTVGSNLMNLIRARKYIYFKPMKAYHLSKHMKPIMVFFLFSVTVQIYTSMDTVMLGFMSSDVQVGYYTAATKMKSILVSLVTALGTVLLPRASYYIENEMEEKFSQIIRKSFQFVIAMALPITLFFMAEAKDTIMFLAGGEYINAVPAMMVITPTIFFIGLSNITGMQVLVPLGLEKHTVISTLVGALVDLVLNTIFIPKFGAAGASFGTLIAEGAVLIVQICQMAYLKKTKYLQIDWRDTFKICISAIIALIAVIVFKHFCFIGNSLLNLISTAIVYFGCYSVLAIIFKENIVEENILIPFIEKLRKK